MESGVALDAGAGAGGMGRWARRRRSQLAVAGLVVGGSLALSACGGGAAADYVQGQPSTPLLSYSAKTKTVSLDLRAADPNGSTPFNFDGATGGQMTITVPVGWTVDATCTNESTVLTHSCAIVANGTTLAFKGSAVPQPTRGIRPGGTETFSFVASRAGSYQLVCLVPGHRDAGMWDHFNVKAGGLPSLARS